MARGCGKGGARGMARVRMRKGGMKEGAMGSLFVFMHRGLQHLAQELAQAGARWMVEVTAVVITPGL